MPGSEGEARPVFTPFPTAVSWSHEILGPRLRPGDWVVDATAGNGHDTLFLAERVLPGGRVFSFDLQEAAVEETRRRLTSAAEVAFGQSRFSMHEVALFCASHARLGELLPHEARGKLRAVMFNLGYLPGGDKMVITREDSTLTAIQQALDWLAEDGVLTLVAYPGHDGGREEAGAVESLMAALPSNVFEAQRIGYINFRPTTPFCLAVRRRAQA